MSVEEAIVEKLRSLPRERQQQLLDFAEFLTGKGEVREPLPPLRGIWNDPGVPEVTEEELAEARREMWGNFARREP